MSTTRARQITVDLKTQEFSIEWADGHSTTFPLDALRRTCPCASCAGGHDKMGDLPDPQIFLLPSFMQWTDVKLETVGAYGLRFIWDDGHDAGIYTWERLRATCPCDTCMATSAK